MYLQKRIVSDEDWARLSRDWRSTDELPEYQWMKETPVAIVEENEMPQWKTPEQLWDAVTAMGTTYVRYPAIGWGAHFYGKSEFLPKYPGMTEEEDFFGDVCKYFHEHGGHVQSYNHFGGVVYGHLTEMHPDWYARLTDNSLMPWNDMHYLGCLCSDGLCEAMIGAIDEYCTKYGPDSVYLDAPAWYHTDCHCEGCKKLYREMWGEELPDGVPTYGTEAADRVEKMRVERLNSLIWSIHEATKKHNVPLFINFRGHNGPCRGDKPMCISMVEGANGGEGYRPKASFWSMATLWRQSESHKNLQLAYCPTGTYYNFRSYDTEEAVVVGMAEAMFGITPYLESATSYLFDKSGGAVLREVCDKIAAHKEMYYRTQPIRDLAIVSDETAMSRLPGEDYRRMVNDFQGCVEALTLGNRHFEIIFDEQISAARLRGYRAVYMPVTTNVSPRMEKELRAYVEAGGNLICGPDFSNYSATHEMLDHFELSDLLGLDYVRRNDTSVASRHQREYRESAGVFPYVDVPEVYVKLVKDLPGMPAESTPVIPFSDTVVRLGKPYIEYAVATPHEDTEVLAELFLPAGGCRGEELTFPEGHPAALTRHKVGAGYVYWMAVRPGLSFILEGRYDEGKFLCAACDAAGEGPAVDFDTAGAVLCFLKDNGKGTAWLHMANYSGAMIERSMCPERILPLYDIPVRVRVSALPFTLGAGEVPEVYLEYGEQKLDASVCDGYVCFTLPVLKLHQSIRFISPKNS